MDSGEANGLAQLAARRGNDGGWGYGRESWTEPTALALLALHTEPDRHTDAERAAIAWLRRTRRPDGGWPPNPRIDQTVTWATSMALLALATVAGEPAPASVEWLLATTGRENALSFRLLRFFSRTEVKDRGGFAGWPWFPGSAAWVAPTGLAMQALRKAAPSQPAVVRQRIQDRVGAGESFLLARRCLDGGWNHGSSRPLGFEAESYPETTGVALLGLAGVAKRSLAPSLLRARAGFSGCRSVQGRAWLRLALATHGEPVPAAETNQAPPERGVVDIAMDVISRAAENGRNVLAL